MGALLSQPWRDLSKNEQENLKFIKTYQPQKNEIKHLRILLHGPVGAGKSSFINSVDSVLQGRVTNRAQTDATSGNSFTKKFKEYKFHKNECTYYSFIFTDIMGFEEQKGVLEEDVKLALMGHVKEEYEFTEKNLTKNSPHYNSSPSLGDRAHVLVSVVPADKVSLLSEEVVKKMRELRLAASDMGIPQLAMLTKVDEVCPTVKDVYKNKFLKEQVDKFSQLLGLPLNCIFLVKNYNSEVNTNPDIDRLILSALRQMIHYGEDYLNDLRTAAANLA